MFNCTGRIFSSLPSTGYPPQSVFLQTACTCAVLILPALSKSNVEIKLKTSPLQITWLISTAWNTSLVSPDFLFCAVIHGFSGVHTRLGFFVYAVKLTLRDRGGRCPRRTAWRRNSELSTTFIPMKDATYGDLHGSAKDKQQRSFAADAKDRCRLSSALRVTNIRIPIKLNQCRIFDLIINWATFAVKTFAKITSYTITKC